MCLGCVLSPCVAVVECFFLVLSQQIDFSFLLPAFFLTGVLLVIWHPGTKAKSSSAGGISCLVPGYSFRGRPAVSKGPRVLCFRLHDRRKRCERYVIARLLAFGDLLVVHFLIRNAYNFTTPIIIRLTRNLATYVNYLYQFLRRSSTDVTRPGCHYQRPTSLTQNT